MGLTIHYTLQAQPETTKVQAHDTINSLQQCALSLLHEGLLAEVSEVLEVTEKTLNTLVEDQTSPWKWAAVQSSVYVALGEGSYSTRHRVTPVEGYLFRTWPGPGSEEAKVGLMHYPKYVEINSVSSGQAKQSFATGLSGWRWSSFCKTTYADQPVAAHLAVIAMLDYAATLPGLTIEVSDEGDYWNNRDVIALAQNFLEDATMLAGLANALGQSVQAPIQERGDYGELVERFEAQASKYHDTVEILKQIVKKDAQDG